MIRYALKCKNDHGFESWFQSAEAYESLTATGLVACPECDDTAVVKTLMAPRVSSGRKAKSSLKKTEEPVMNAPSRELVEAIRTIREHVEKTSDYVGDGFAKEARAMHLGEAPHRSIYGEVRPDERRKLQEDGVPAVPLPFIPRQKTN